MCPGMPDGRVVSQRVDSCRNGTRPFPPRVYRHCPREKIMDRPRLATVWLGGCSGCHMSFLDLDESLLELAQKVDLVFSPVIDIKEYPHNVDACLVEGAVCNEEHLETARKIRERTRYVISFGDCAVTGNVSAIRNQLGLSNVENVLQRAYVESADLNQQIP